MRISVPLTKEGLLADQYGKFAPITRSAPSPLKLRTSQPALKAWP